jgi:hypothetical protein
LRGCGLPDVLGAQGCSGHGQAIGDIVSDLKRVMPDPTESCRVVVNHEIDPSNRSNTTSPITRVCHRRRSFAGVRPDACLIESIVGCGELHGIEFER